MKKERTFTPAIKNFEHILKCPSFKNVICIFTLFVCIILTSCGNVSATQETQEDDSSSVISSFNGYDWGTSYDEIRSSEITENMKEKIDYSEDQTEGMTALSLYHKDISGYDVRVDYAFSDQKLTAGMFQMDGDDEEVYEDMLVKISSKYGDPYLKKESTGWGRCAIWIDGEKNIICSSEILDIIYAESGSHLLEYLNDQFIEFHELDLLSEIDKFNNTDGL